MTVNENGINVPFYNTITCLYQELKTVDCISNVSDGRLQEELELLKLEVVEQDSR